MLHKSFQNSVARIKDRMNLFSPWLYTKFRGPSNLPFVIIFIFTIFTHGLLLLNEGKYWDTWLIHTFIKDGSWNLLSQLYNDSGRPMMGYLIAGIGHLPNFYFVERVLEVFSIFIFGVLVYKICTLPGFLRPSQGLCIALLGLCYPAFYQFMVGFDVYMYYYCFFMLGVYLVLRNARNNNPPWLIRAPILLLFFVSFDLNSLLVYYFGFLALLFWVFKHPEQNRHFYRRLVRFLIHYWDLLHSIYFLACAVYLLETRRILHELQRN
jgi:hypothetical protein